MVKTLDTPEFDCDICIASVTVYKKNDIKVPAEYQLLCMLAVRITNLIKKNADLLDYGLDILSQAYITCKHSSSFSYTMDMLLAQTMVNRAVDNEARKITQGNYSSSIRLDSRRQKHMSMEGEVACAQKRNSQTEGQHSSLHELLADESADSPDEQVERNTKQRAMARACKAVLSAKEQQVIDYIAEGLSYTEIGKEMGISASYAARLFKAALAKLGAELGTNPDFKFKP